MICVCPQYGPVFVMLGLFGSVSLLSATDVYPQSLWLKATVSYQFECTLQDFDNESAGLEINENSFIQIRRHHLQDNKPAYSVVATVNTKEAWVGVGAWAINGSSVSGALKFGVGYIRYSFVAENKTEDEFLKNSRFECVAGVFSDTVTEWGGRFISVDAAGIQNDKTKSAPRGFVLERRFHLTVSCTGTGLQFCNQSFDMSARDNCEAWSSCAELGNERLGMVLQCQGDVRSFDNCTLKVNTYLGGKREVLYDCVHSKHGASCSLVDTLKKIDQAEIAGTSCVVAWFISGVLFTALICSALGGLYCCHLLKSTKNKSSDDMQTSAPTSVVQSRNSREYIPFGVVEQGGGNTEPTNSRGTLPGPLSSQEEFDHSV